MKDFEKFIDGFRNFRRFYFDAENDYYTSLNKGQHPKAIVIACSDSRADPALLMGCDPGDIFVVRNVATWCPMPTTPCVAMPCWPCWNTGYTTSRWSISSCWGTPAAAASRPC